MTSSGHLLLILHRVPEPGNPARSSAIFWRSPRGDWMSTEGGSGLGALNAHFESWRKAVDRLEDQMQQHPSADNYFEVLQSTTPLLRTMRNAHRVMQDAREACPEDRAILLTRDDAGDLERAIDLLHNDAKNGMEFMIAKQGEVQAQRAHQLVLAGHRLNVLIALFLPLTAISSVFGMNLPHGLEHWQSPWLFWALLGTALTIGVLLMTAVLLKLNPGPSWKSRG
jgi:Mg2+ and Co2+ transporter CorA